MADMEPWQVDRGDGKPFQMRPLTNPEGVRLLSNADERLRQQTALDALNASVEPASQTPDDDLYTGTDTPHDFRRRHAITPEEESRLRAELSPKLQPYDDGKEHPVIDGAASPASESPHAGSGRTISIEQRQVLIDKVMTGSPEELREALKLGLGAVHGASPEEQRAIAEQGQRVLEGMSPEQQQALLQRAQEVAKGLSPEQQKQLDEYFRHAMQEKGVDARSPVAAGHKPEIPTEGRPTEGAGDKSLENDKASGYKKNDHARVEKVQNDLKALGIDCGSIDGKFGPKTEAAVKAFEERMGIKPPDGKLSEKELELLHQEVEKARAQGKGKEGQQQAVAEKPKQEGRPKNLDGAHNITMDEAKIAMAAADMNFDDMTSLSRDLAGPTGLNRKVDVNTKIMAYLDDLGANGATITVNGAEMTAAEARKAVGLAGKDEATTQLAGSVITGIAAEMGVALAQAREQGLSGQQYASADVGDTGRPMGGGGEWRVPQSGRSA